MMVRHENPSTGVSEFSCTVRHKVMRTEKHMESHVETHICVTIVGRLSRPETVVMGTSTLIIGKLGKLLGSENINK